MQPEATPEAGEFGSDSPQPLPRPQRPPSPPWVGALATFCLFASFASGMTYNYLDWEWQQQLGGWNFAVQVFFLVSLLVIMLRWRSDPARH